MGHRTAVGSYPITGFSNGLPFTISGSGFGTDSGTLLLADQGGAGPGVLDPQWTGGVPDANSTAVYNLQNQVGASFSPTGAAIGTPHSFITNIIAGAANGTLNNTGFIISPYLRYNVPGGAGSTYTIVAWYYHRGDPNWVFGIGSPNDNNLKLFNLNNGSFPLSGTTDWFVAFNPAGAQPSDNVGVQYQINLTDNTGNSLENPDGNGHNLFWLDNDNPYNPSNGINGWNKSKYAVCVTSATGLGGGFIKCWDNGGNQTMNYHARTCATSDTQHTICLRTYNRDYPDPHNYYYFGDIYIKISGAAKTDLAYLEFANSSTYSSATIVEYQPTTSWANLQLQGVCNRGNLPVGQLFWAYANTESGSVIQEGPFLMGPP